MKNKGIFFLLPILALSSLVACKNKSVNYSKTSSGLPYKIFRSKDTQKVVPGDYLKLSVTQKINDSVTMTTSEGVPVYLFISNTENQPYDISELWTKLHRGDSLEVVQMMDTFIKRAPDRVPKNYKNGDRVITGIRVLDIFHTDSAAQADELVGRKQFAEKESEKIKKYLDDKKISAQRTPSGAYVQVIKPGEGNLADTGNLVTVNYTGTSWSGKVFDSNTDSAFHHIKPYSFVAGAQQMIKGFDEAMFFLRKGSVAKIYVPSMLAYGPSPNSPDIKPYESLIFDVQIVDLKEKAPEAPAPMQKVDVPQQKN